MKKILVKKHFISWLKDRIHTNRKVGECGDARNCVLARYLNDKSGRKRWEVNDNEAIRWSAGHHVPTEYALPAWAVELVSDFDELGDTKPTARAVLKLLRA